MYVLYALLEGPNGYYVCYYFLYLYVCMLGGACYVSYGDARYTQLAGPITCVRARPVILSERGPLCELGLGALHSLGRAHYTYGMCRMWYFGEVTKLCACSFQFFFQVFQDQNGKSSG